MANIGMLKNHRVVNSLNNLCLYWPRMLPKRKKSWCNDQQKEKSLATCVTKISELNSSGWMIINAKNCACAEGFKDLTALMNGSLLISIFELSQEFRRILYVEDRAQRVGCRLRFKLALQPIYFTMLAFYFVHLLWEIVFKVKSIALLQCLCH